MGSTSLEGLNVCNFRLVWFSLDKVSLVECRLFQFGCFWLLVRKLISF